MLPDAPQPQTPGSAPCGDHVRKVHYYNRYADFKSRVRLQKRFPPPRFLPRRLPQLRRATQGLSRQRPRRRDRRRSRGAGRPSGASIFFVCVPGVAASRLVLHASCPCGLGVMWVVTGCGSCPHLYIRTMGHFSAVVRKKKFAAAIFYGWNAPWRKFICGALVFVEMAIKIE